MKTLTPVLTSLALSLVMLACGTSKSDPVAAASGTTWTDTKMQSLVATSCAKSSCHDGTQTPNYKVISEANMKLDKLAATRAANGEMPSDGALSTANKAIFANFYK